MSFLYADALIPIAAKTASYQIVADDLGKLFTTRGHASGTITLTLPPVANVQAGWWCEFFTVGAGVLSIAAPTDKLITFNDADADAIEIGTASEIIGAGVKVVFDGTSYLAFVMLEETATLTVTT